MSNKQVGLHAATNSVGPWEAHSTYQEEATAAVEPHSHKGANHGTQ